MAVRTERRRGKRVLVIDITYRKADGKWARFRRDSIAPTKAAAQAEERRILERIALSGSPYQVAALTVQPEVEITYAQVVREYRADFVPSELKRTTAAGYEKVLDYHLLPRFADYPISAVGGVVATKLDQELGQLGAGKKKSKRGRSTRNNVQIVLRSTLRFAVSRGYLPAMPAGLPKLKQPVKVVLDIPTDGDIVKILDVSTAAQRRAFALMAYAGLRPNEVRALEWPEVALRRIPPMLTVRRGRSYGEEHTPKTGVRMIPIDPALGVELASTARRRKGFVARTSRRKPWGQTGINQAFRRIAKTLGLPKTWTVYYLRHYAITSWLRRGIPVHVVMVMAGHSNLATTEKYVHVLHADLEAAARLLGNIVETPSDAAE